MIKNVHVTVAISAWRKYWQVLFYLYFSAFSNFFQETIQCFYTKRSKIMMILKTTHPSCLPWPSWLQVGLSRWEERAQWRQFWTKMSQHVHCRIVFPSFPLWYDTFHSSSDSISQLIWSLWPYLKYSYVIIPHFNFSRLVSIIRFYYYYFIICICHHSGFLFLKDAWGVWPLQWAKKWHG